MDLLLVLWNKR